MLGPGGGTFTNRMPSTVAATSRASPSSRGTHAPSSSEEARREEHTVPGLLRVHRDGVAALGESEVGTSVESSLSSWMPMTSGFCQVQGEELAPAP
jgi:hypothetical protein